MSNITETSHLLDMSEIVMLLSSYTIRMAMDTITRGVFLLVSIGTLCFMYEQQPSRMFNTMNEERRPWQEVAAAKRDENMAKIPQEWHLPDTIIEESKNQTKIVGRFIENLLDSETHMITSLGVGELLRLIHNGSLTALQVTTAFCKRGAYAHQLVRLPYIYAMLLS